MALTPPVEPGRDHVLGPPDAEMTLVEYGSYACPHCHAVHEVVEGLRSRFGDRMGYVFRHLPVADSADAARAAERAGYAAQTSGRFWEGREARVERGPAFQRADFGRAGAGAARAAGRAEYAAQTTGRFWEVHEALMERGPAFTEGDFGRIARDADLPPSDAAHGPALAAAQARVREDAESARRSGALVP